jgi:hypothetical protein
MNTVTRLSAVMLVAALAGGGPVHAQDDEPERDMNAEHCVRIASIKDISIVNDTTLIFRMRGGKYYRNDLPHRCLGLRRSDTLMYRASTGLLCNVDLITVLEDWGFGFSPGVSCGLGMFTPVTPEEAEDILKYDD